MILDVLEGVRRYAALHKGFDRAIEFLLRPDLKALPVGKYEIDGDHVYAMVSMDQGRKKEDARLETHENYIDIQLILAGTDESCHSRCEFLKKRGNGPSGGEDAGVSLKHPGGSTMYRIWIVFCLATFLLAGQTIAADQAQKAETAESKAEVLEENAAADGSKATPSKSEIITKPEAQAVDPVGEEQLDDAITCLARTIYWETRGDGAAGMEAIANVVMNRLGHEGFPNTICEVVRQGREQGTCQFSWWCDGRSDDAEENESYAIAKEIARKALNRQLKDRTGGAMYFHHRKVAPSWSEEYIMTVKVGAHIFYKPHGGAAK